MSTAFEYVKLGMTITTAIAVPLAVHVLAVVRANAFNRGKLEQQQKQEVQDREREAKEREKLQKQEDVEREKLQKQIEKLSNSLNNGIKDRVGKAEGKLDRHQERLDEHQDRLDFIQRNKTP